MEIIYLLQAVNHLHTKTTWRQLATIVEAMLAMTGRVTMLGISRWTEVGGSYRTIQRFSRQQFYGRISTFIYSSPIDTQ